MHIRKFHLENDLEKLENYLTEQYLENKNMTSWLPQRLHDLIYRMGAQEAEGGYPLSMDYIFLWEEGEQILAGILPDGDAVYMSIRKDFRHLFPEILSYSEKNCLPLFHREEDGSVDFLVVVHDSLTDMTEHLSQMGYKKQAEQDYDNYVYPQEIQVSVNLPQGFRLLYGHEYADDCNKWSALNMGFHPELEYPGYRNTMDPYEARKKSSLYSHSFECLVVDENAQGENDVCSYCFVYVDEKTKTAWIEPVSTRAKYQHKGIGTAMMHGVILRCKELGIQKCYVNSYDWRRKFYNAAGFITEDCIGFWHKTIH